MNEILVATTFGIIVVVMVMQHLTYREEARAKDEQIDRLLNRIREEARAKDAQLDRLLNRIMARNYEEYSDVEVRNAKAKEPVTVVTVEELKRSIIAEEQGVPI